MSSLNKDHWATLRVLLDRALELPPEERPSWLAVQRISHPTVVPEIEGLLAAEQELDRQGFLGEAGREELLSERPTLAGQRLGHYSLVQPLGHGGMGSVWLARRTDGRFEGEFAIKFLNLALLDPVGEARFKREGTLLAKLAHPNIARLLDAGVAEAGQPYLVLERIEGRPIDDYCEQQGLTPLERVKLFRQLLDAVAHAHANFIVHRDLKPSNILVTAEGVPKLLDFGIAKLLDDRGSEMAQATLTEAGLGAFTPEYAAPEQVLGEPVSAATDVYSLGVLLYRLLAGRHPTSEGARTPADHMRAVVDTDPTRLSDAVTASGHTGSGGLSPEKLRRLYLGDLDNILAKALRKNPAERYPTAAALADDLSRYLRDEPVSARPDSLGYRAAKFIRRHRAGVAAGVISLAVLLGATAFSIWQLLEARHQRDEAQFQAKRADAQLAFHNLVFSTVGDAPITMREILDRGKSLLEKEYGGEPRFNALITQSLAAQYGEIGANDAALSMLAQSDSLARLSGSASVLLQNLCQRAGIYSNNNQAGSAHAALDTIRPLLATAAPEDLPDCLVVQAGVFTDDGQADSGVATARRAIALMEQQGDTSAGRFVGGLNILANSLENSHHRREALAVYQRLANLLDRTGRRETVSRNVISNNIGIALSNLGQLAEAEPVLKETADQFRRSNPNHEVHPAIIVNYARTLLGLNRLDSAEAYIRQLREQGARDGAANFEQTALFFQVRADVMRRRLDQAATHLEDFKRLMPRLSRPRPDDVLELEGTIAQGRGQYALAHEKLVAALGASYRDGKPGYGTRSLLVRTAETALELGKTAEALQYARTADSIAAEDSLARSHSGFVGEARLLEARALLATGDSAEARNQIGPAIVALKNGLGPTHPLALQAESLKLRLGLH